MRWTHIATCRDLGRTVLVDDTPLAFLHQPDNGVPVLGFRGDPDDRLLMEAVLPLLEVRLLEVLLGVGCVFGWGLRWALHGIRAICKCSKAVGRCRNARHLSSGREIGSEGSARL